MKQWLKRTFYWEAFERNLLVSADREDRILNMKYLCPLSVTSQNRLALRQRKEHIGLQGTAKMTLASRQSGGQAGTGRPNKVKTSPPKTWQPFIRGSENAGHGIYNFRNPWNENTEAFLEPGLRRPELGLCGMWLCYKSLWVSASEQWYSPLTRNECWLLTVIICGWGEGFPCSTGDFVCRGQRYTGWSCDLLLRRAVRHYSVWIWGCS